MSITIVGPKEAPKAPKGNFPGHAFVIEQLLLEHFGGELE